MDNLNENKQKPESPIRKALGGLKAYLSDWRNLLGHGLVGVLFVVAAIWVPVKLWIKLIVIACLIGFNVWRMKRKSKKQDKPEAPEVTEISNTIDVSDTPITPEHDNI